MGYTIPESVDTKAQAILALASTIADEDKSALGNGSVNRALDVLADVLAGENVDVPQTNAGAILALAQYAQGGGGSQAYSLSLSDDCGNGTLEFHEWSDNEFGGIIETATAGQAVGIKAVPNAGATYDMGDMTVAADGIGLDTVPFGETGSSSERIFVMPASDVSAWLYFE